MKSEKLKEEKQELLHEKLDQEQDISLITFPAFKNFDEKELATVIMSLQCLKASILKKWLLLPILCICTVFIILLFMITSKKIKKFLLYSECTLR